jgi:hypothetical protein
MGKMPYGWGFQQVGNGAGAGFGNRKCKYCGAFKPLLNIDRATIN